MHHYVYWIRAGQRHYIGATVNPSRRLRQHNGELTGGAARTHGCGVWTIEKLVTGFRTWKEALQFEWAFLSEPEDNVDLMFFEDLLSCAWNTWDVDLDRVYTTGMSAGGLWTSYLLLHEAPWLAAAAPLSGGANTAQYVQPARRLPVLLTWGGPSDFAVGYDFNQANITFSELLRGDDHWVGECEHDGGHVPPNGAKDYVWQFFEDHPLGVDPEPYADAMPSSFPSYCSVP